MTSASPDRAAPGAGRRLSLAPDAVEQPDGRHDERTLLQLRHTEGLTRLLESRSDLRGVHALADLRADAVRWSA